MREIDRKFLTIFKDLKIVEEDNGGYNCYIGKKHLDYKDVVKLVKDYQNLLITELLESQENNG